MDTTGSRKAKNVWIPLIKRCPLGSGTLREKIEVFRWQIEELKTSVFAQELGTDGAVSSKRLRQLQADILSELEMSSCERGSIEAQPIVGKGWTGPRVP